jgi:hypothetical protein
LSAETFLSHCQGVKQTGPGRWICLCPAHEDKHPSMNVKELADGKVLVICRAGCSNADIIGATGLHWDALFPAPDNTIAEARREARRIPTADVLEALRGEMLIVAVSAFNLAEGVELSDADRDRLRLAAQRIEAARDMSHG